MKVAGWFVTAVALFVAAAATAQEAETPPPSPDDVLTGEIRVSLSSDYAKLRVDGEEWEEHAFTDNGRMLLVHSVRRTEEHRLTLTPLTSELAPVELVIRPEDWKLVSVAKNEKVWRVDRKVVFEKKKAAPPAPAPAPPSPTPAPGK